MLRARSQQNKPVRASTYQYAPSYLLFRRGTRWDCVDRSRQAAVIRDMMPAEPRAGWMHVVHGNLGEGRECEAERDAAWVESNGPDLGFRTPNAAEHARAMGMGEYCRDLGLQDFALYNGQGNAP